MKETDGIDWEYKLYLSRVEEAGMQVLTQSILDKDWQSADKCLEILTRLSIV